MEKFHLVCVVTIDTLTTTFRKVKILSPDAQKMQGELVSFRDDLHKAIALFDNPDEAIAGLAALQAAFLMPFEGNQPIVRGAMAGETRLQIELYPPRADASRNITETLMALPEDALDGEYVGSKLTATIGFSRGAKVVKELKFVKETIDEIYTQYLAALFSTIPCDEIRASLSQYVTDVQDILIALDQGSETGRHFHLTLGEFSIQINLEPTEPSVEIPPKKEHRVLH